MDDNEREAFLAAPFVGALSITRRDGSPLVVPVWYRWDSAAVVVWTDPAFPWARRLAEEPRVAFAVFEHAAPFRSVYVRGTASVREGSFAELREEARAIVARYVAPADLERTVDAYDRGAPKALVRITPSSIRSHANLR